jgi:hypothetical protein
MANGHTRRRLVVPIILIPPPGMCSVCKAEPARYLIADVDGEIVVLNALVRGDFCLDCSLVAVEIARQMRSGKARTVTAAAIAAAEHGSLRQPRRTGERTRW